MAFRVITCTWNVNGQLTPEDISEWLRRDDSKADVIAIGYVTLVPLNNIRVYSHSGKTLRLNRYQY